MTNSLTSSKRQLLLSRLRLLRDWRRRQSESHPRAYRQLLRLAPYPAPTLARLALPWQQRDLEALDPAWLALAGRGASAPVRRAYLERPRGHSKTSDTAVQLTWILQWSPHRLRGLAAAADQDQANLIHTAIGDVVRHNRDLCADLRLQRLLVKNRRTGSELQIISSDVGSSWGQLPDFVVCDELCHWNQPDLWYSLCSSAAKKPSSVLLVLTNAGIGTGWQWDVREAARTSPEWYFSSLTGSQAPWITPATLAEQRRLLPPAVYARLWENVWQHSDGEFVTLAEAEACRDDLLTPRTHGVPGRRYFAAVDYAEKRDYTVGVVLHRDDERLVVDRMDVAVPRPGAPIPVQWVENWIAGTAAAFPGTRFVLDEYQLLSVLQRLAGHYDLARFDFAGGKGNHALTLALRNRILQRQIAWYPNCGQLPDEPRRDDLETELASLIVRTISGNHLRIDHRRGGHHHDDRSFALGAAVLEALRHSSEPDWLTITSPTPQGDFAW